MPRAALWGGLALAILLAAMAADGLRTGGAWSRTGRDTSRRLQPLSYWLSIALQLAMAVVCLWCSAAAWSERA